MASYRHPSNTYAAALYLLRPVGQVTQPTPHTTRTRLRCDRVGRQRRARRGAAPRARRASESAPPDTSLKSRLSMPSASADAFFSTCSWYALNSGPAACFSATARPVIVWLCGPPCAVAHHHVSARSTARRRYLVHQRARPLLPAPASFLSTRDCPACLDITPAHSRAAARSNPQKKAKPQLCR